MTLSIDEYTTKTRSLDQVISSPTIVPHRNGGIQVKFKYYVPFLFKDGFGWRFISRETPLDTEDAIRDEHLALEKELGFTVVILDWKRID